MKITCPICKTVYEIPEERLPDSVSTASCKKCGTRLLIDKETGKVEAATPPEPTPNEAPTAPKPSPANLPSIMSRASGEEKGRDNLATGIFFAGLLLLLVTGYFAVKSINVGSSFRSIESFSKWVMDSYLMEKERAVISKKDTRPQTPQVRDSRRHLAQGHKFFREKKLEDAIQEYNEATQIDPAYSDAYYWRGRAFFQKGERDKAIADYKKTIELSPSYTAAYDSLGWIYNQMGKWDESINYLNKSIELRPKNGWAYYNRGLCYYKKGDLEKALQDAKQACDLGYKQGCKVYEQLKK